MEKVESGAALGLWDGRSINDKLKARIETMAAKVRKLGGIKKIDVGECEARRIKKTEQMTGEKIEVIPASATGFFDSVSPPPAPSATLRSE